MMVLWKHRRETFPKGNIFGRTSNRAAPQRSSTFAASNR